ncbi:MAG TPA: hypothetical protein VLM91_21365, partial [Candidatus Methylomirabilis sp.]|nr:hypothetical protein [Candidatus Methylomirabilis sp.]
VCPVEDCITMVNEQAFNDNSSQFDAYQKDTKTYLAWVDEKIKDKAITHRSHGFQYRGRYEEELAEAATEGGGDD